LKFRKSIYTGQHIKYVIRYWKKRYFEFNVFLYVGNVYWAVKHFMLLNILNIKLSYNINSPLIAQLVDYWWAINIGGFFIWNIQQHKKMYNSLIVTTPFLLYFIYQFRRRTLTMITFSNKQCFHIVLSFEWTIEQCTCIVFFYLLSDDLIEQWFTIVLSSRLLIVLQVYKL